MQKNERFIIEGKKPLKGEIEILGSKNAAGPALAATLLTSGECIIDNLPLILDIYNMIDIIKELGGKIEFLEERKIRVRAKEINPERLEFSKKVSAMRMSVLLIGALSSRFDFFKIPCPGGDRIGVRPIGVHIKALKELGIDISQEDGYYKVKRKKIKSKEREIVLEEFSVTASENLILASVLLSGKTIIKGIAVEPHVQDLIKMLKKMGAKIEFLQPHILKIEGVKSLSGVSHRIIPDYIETGTIILAGILTEGTIKIKNASLSHLDLFLLKLKELGGNFKIKGSDEIEVFCSKKLKAVRVQALPYPGFPTDLLPVIIPVLTQAEGKSLVHDPLYENRLNFVQELKKMGADIEIVDPHRLFVFGRTSLFGTRVECWDIRAGACLLLAGLIAKGKTILENISQIDRGYEKIDERLNKLGAKIQRV